MTDADQRFHEFILLILAGPGHIRPDTRWQPVDFQELSEIAHAVVFKQIWPDQYAV